MASDLPVTFVAQALRQRRQLFAPLYLLGALIAVLGVLGLVLGIVVLHRLGRDSTPYYADVVEHFKYGSIGSEPESGLPYWVFQAIPTLFPEVFGDRGWEVFGFLYEPDGKHGKRDLPIGFGRREVKGVDVVWLNCAVCHTSTVTVADNGERRIVPGMPSNNLDLYAFSSFLLDIADDERLSPDHLLPAMHEAGADFGWFEEQVWRYVVLPRVREGFVQRRARLLPLLEQQAEWGPGRVDTFNPYKMIQFDKRLTDMSQEELVGTSDFPSIFLQAPREGMQLHWDGNNPSLAERNLSAAIGAGVTPETVDHGAVERIAAWLQDLRPPASPYRPDQQAVERGKSVYLGACAACHGYNDGDRYVFEGAYLGKVTPIEQVGTDRNRLDSYTAELSDDQKTLFAGTPYQFSHFRKTDGYANQPLDGLWLRAPYLHNGSVPTLLDLLVPPAQRPVSFVRGVDVVDTEKGGFVAPTCVPGAALETGFCFDTMLRGNGNGGHTYGTDLSAEQKADLLAYLKTF
jgi:mono/diheme cytochrome c family protein